MYFGFQEVLILIILFAIYRFIKGISNYGKPSTNNDKKQNIDISNGTKMVIPETCPYCKNPNAKKAKLCEWCGNQIC